MSGNINKLKKSRKEALKVLADYYFTGVPCKHGHIAKRQTSSGACMECISVMNKKTKDDFKKRKAEKINNNVTLHETLHETDGNITQANASERKRTKVNVNKFAIDCNFAFDPRIQGYSEVYQRRYIVVLCIAFKYIGESISDDDMAFALRISPEEWLETKGVLCDAGVIDSHNNLTNESIKKHSIGG